MKTNFVFALILLCSSARARPLNLDDAYAAALKQSETLAEKGATYAQLQAQIQEMWSAVRPRITLTGNHFWEDTPGPNITFPLPANQDTVAITGHQAIFAGLRDFLAVKSAKAQTKSAELSVLRAKQTLYQDVATAYINLLSSRHAIAIRTSQVEVTAGRVKELKNFESIGRSRQSEVLAAQSQWAQTRADLETARGQDLMYLATLQFLTGIDGPLEPAEVAQKNTPLDLDLALKRSADRPDVEAARNDLQAAQYFVSMQERQRWPVIALDGDYYLRRPQTYTQHVHWDATLSASLPLYWGGQISAQTKEASAQETSSEAAESLARRQAELDVRVAFSSLQSNLTIGSALEEALSLAQANTKAQTIDYRNGLVTNLDVLNSLTTEHDTRLNLDGARLQTILAAIRLDVAAGGPEGVK